jgi:DNA-binding transcriptional LysR family regulator
VPSFRAHAPAAELKLTEAGSAQLLDYLHDGQLDVAFIRPPDDCQQLTVEVIWSEPMLLALPAGHALGTNAALRLAQLQGEPLILFPRASAPRFHDQLIAACHQAGVSPRIVQEAAAMPTIISLVAAGLGAALVPRSVSPLASGQVTYHRLRDTRLRAEIAMATHANNDSPLLDAFARHVRQVACPSN